LEAFSQRLANSQLASQGNKSAACRRLFRFAKPHLARRVQAIEAAHIDGEHESLRLLGGLAMTVAIRPTLQSLRCLPTLHAVSESWGRLELKLETRDTRYWITTEGVSKKTNGTPINYVIDYVTVEKLSEDGNWDLKAVYSPEAWKLSQAFDYCQILQQDLHRINAALQARFSWDLVRERAGVQAELEAVNRIISVLSEKVRSRS
jgi:hypothetical protein